jgi:hypothetical protein
MEEEIKAQATAKMRTPRAFFRLDQRFRAGKASLPASGSFGKAVDPGGGLILETF